jgi:hypothetical protein
VSLSVAALRKAVGRSPGAPTWKAEWVEIGGQRFYARSRYEVRYGHYLEWLKQQGEIKSWRHEPRDREFWFESIKRGVRSYLPDFEVVERNGSVSYHETKGWLDPKSRTKLRRMAKYYPHIRVVLIDKNQMAAIGKTVGGLIPGWT